MTKDYSPDRLDIKAFMQANAHLTGRASLLKYERLAHEAQGIHPDLYVNWQAQGELRVATPATATASPAEAQGAEPWLHLTVQATLPMLCQCCLTPVDVPLEVDRWFRFVADEATAEALDDEMEEDLLAISREFDLHALVEDELLMALPVVARHDECPVAVPMASSAEDFDAASAENPNPFAALTGFKTDKPDR